jgi:hypothetical protein
VIVGVLLFAPVGSHTAFALCTDYAYKWAADDCNLPVDTTYDPCGSWLTWTFHFRRNSNEAGTGSSIKYSITSGNVWAVYYHSDYQHGEERTFSDTKWVGSISSSTLKIQRMTGTGCYFEDLWNRAEYFNKPSERPSGP